LRSQSRSAVGWILAPALIGALWLPGGAAAAPKTGQSPHCKRYCMAVEPQEGPEGSVFRFEGRGWEAAGASRSARAGEAQAGDRERKIVSGAGFMFSQRTVTRKPRYRVIVPECGDCG
jgi:hypothetical protein